MILDNGNELTTFQREGLPGIAWWAIGNPPMFDEWGETDGWDPDFILAHMIGDDRIYRIELTEVIPITDDEYCSQCGQIGCGHG